MNNDLRAPDYSHILSRASCGRANLVNIFGDSLAATLAVLAARLRRLGRNRHLDINIPRCSLILIFAIVSWLMIKTSNNCHDCTSPGRQVENVESLKNYELIKDVGSLAGATITILFAMTNMHREYHYKKRDKASQYVSAWLSQDYSQIRKTVAGLKAELFWDHHPTQFNPEIFDRCHSTVAQYKRNADGIQILQRVQSDILKRLHDKKRNSYASEKHAVHSLLSFLEHMGQDVKDHVADSDYLKDYFYSIVIDNYELFRKYIEYVQIDRSRRVTYCNIVFLAQVWEKEGDLPELPRICLRPPVITADDLIEAFSLKYKSH